MAAAKELNLGLRVLAINHWQIAIDTHSSNHPDIDHLCEELDAVSPRKAVPSGKLDLLMAAPECIFHSVARGGRPVKDQSRSSAWMILRWCEALIIKDVLIENVPEFKRWGPLIRKHVVRRDKKTGKMIGSYEYYPDPKRKGETYQAFLAALRSLGYRVEDRIVNAANHGAATTRERLFIRARRGRSLIHWPEPSHARAARKTLFGSKEQWRPAREIIDWSIESQSIFERKRPLAPNTMARILAGLKKFGGLEFIVPQGSDGAPRSVDDPAPTITTTSRGIGLCQPFIVPQHAGGRNRSIEEPLPTITGNGTGLVQPFLVVLRNHADARSLDEPIPTVTAGGTHLGLCEPFLIGAGGPEGQGTPRSIDNPLRTVLTDDHQGLVQPFLVRYNGNHRDRRDGDHRTQSVEGPLGTLDTSNRYGLCQPFIVILRNNSTVRSVEDPLSTISTKGAHHGLVEPFLVPFFGERDGQQPRTHSLEEPLPAVTSHGAGALVEPYLISVNHGNDGPTSNSRRAYSLDDPMPTITGKNAWALIESFLLKYNSTGGTRSLEDPLDTISTKDRFAIVQMYLRELGIDAYDLALLDIRFRMLQPHELAGAMSFPETYIFVGNREQKVKQIGNAVEVRTAKALCLSVLDDAA